MKLVLGVQHIRLLGYISFILLQPRSSLFSNIILKKCFNLIFLLKVADVFTFAQRSVIFPSGPLYCRNSRTLKPRFVRALKRIFIHCDRDRDGSLSATELYDFQVLLFPSHIEHQNCGSFIVGRDGALSATVA